MMKARCGVFALILLAVISTSACQGAGAKHEATQADLVQSSGAAVSTTNRKCAAAQARLLSRLAKRWEPVATAGMNGQFQASMAVAWNYEFARGMSRLSRMGCPTSTPELIVLRGAQEDLSYALDNGFLLEDAVPQVGAALRQAGLSQASGSTGAPSGQTDVLSCADLSDVHVSYAMATRSNGVGKDVWPRVTVRNAGTEDAKVSLSGDGEATSTVLPDSPLHMMWGLYDGDHVVRSGDTKVINLGRNLGETLLVADGAEVTKFKITAKVSTTDGALQGCGVQTRKRH